MTHKKFMSWKVLETVLSHLNTLSCQSYFFQRVSGVCKIVVEIPEGWGLF